VKRDIDEVEWEWSGECVGHLILSGGVLLLDELVEGGGGWSMHGSHPTTTTESVLLPLLLDGVSHNETVSPTVSVIGALLDLPLASPPPVTSFGESEAILGGGGGQLSHLGPWECGCLTLVGSLPATTQQHLVLEALDDVHVGDLSGKSSGLQVSGDAFVVESAYLTLHGTDVASTVVQGEGELDILTQGSYVLKRKGSGGDHNLLLIGGGGEGTVDGEVNVLEAEVVSVADSRAQSGASSLGEAVHVSILLEGGDPELRRTRH